MTSLIEWLNQSGDSALRFAWPMLWQSSLLIGLLYGLEWAVRRKVRAGVRYALWLLVLVKLVLPPSLALPTAPAWWLWRSTPPPGHRPATVVVTYGETSAAPLPSPAAAVTAPAPPVHLSGSAVILLTWVSGSALLLGWLLLRWCHITRQVRSATEAPAWLNTLLEETRRAAGVRRTVRLKLLERTVSPAVCGLLRPVVLVPRLLADQLSPAQARAILWHELTHLRRGDVWVNCFQTLLQLAYWWHPLLWLANSRIRSAREEAVDDAVMLALQEEAESYAPTLLEVARLALHRPLASLGLVGILESQRSLRQRIERLLEFQPPRKTGMTFAAVLCVLAFGAIAVPMGEGPGKPSSAPESSPNASSAPFSPSTPEPTSREAGIPQPVVAVEPAAGTAAAPSPASVKSGSVAVPLAREMAGSSTNQIVKMGAGRQALFSKLERIRLDDVSFDALPLGEVIHLLNQEIKNADPASTGVNFILTTPSANTGSSINPATGLPQSGASEPVDISSIPITIKPALHQVRLLEVLDAVVKVANKPIKYSIEDYAVVFSAKVDNSVPPLYTRLYKVDLNALRYNLEDAKVLSEAPSLLPVELQRAVRAFLAKKGAVLAPPKTLFLNDRNGALIARGTLQDLDIIEQVLQTLNRVPTQINVEAKFLALPEETAAALWKQLDVTKENTTNRITVLKPSHAQAVLKTLGATPQTEALSDMGVTTVNGRQTLIQCTDLMTIVTNLNPQAFSSPGVSNNSTGPNGLYSASTMPFGPSLELLPTLETNSTMELTLIASITAFLGYDPPTNSVPVYIKGKKQHAPVLQPRYHVSQASRRCSVQDGDTIVLGGLQFVKAELVKDKVPVLGDVPLVGKLFRSESRTTEKKAILVFITPTLIDAAGNRLYSDDTRPAPKTK